MEAISGDTAVEIVTTIFVLSTMFSMGVKLSVTQLFGALRDRQLLTKSLAVNLVAVPIVAYLLVRTVSVGPAYATGFLLLAVSPGAPFGPKFAEISDSDIAFASGLMAILCLLSVVTIPISLVVLAPGDVVVDPIAIGRMVLEIQIVPLIAGLGLSYLSPELGERMYAPIQRLSDVSFVGLIAVLLAVYSGELQSLVGTGTLGLSAVVVAVSLLLGYGFGGPVRERREVLATTTTARNAAVALFIATAGFSDPTVLTVVLGFSFVSVIGAGALASAWR
ncbi:bile acid:sodium symporter family protein [Halorubrum sp. SD683]|uniref:bile acid:sodium symporter family protein n=1 Tax=Halorubrum sp. SD683 TaxID=1855873 RepID=UPI000A2DB499|nr:bile acid:sodium symporter [Halorubrum sp. SD683]OTF01776.1 sodium symporter [Halorubrum sp. SD683]